jgi:hypothetical protein
MVNNKKGAIEMSMTTVVVIVLAMSMLILGLVLVRSIFKGATESVNILNDKVRGEISNLFTEESTGMIAVKLGSDKLARVPIGTENFGLGVGARSSDGSAITSGFRMKYTLSIPSSDDCITKNGLDNVKTLFPLNTLCTQTSCTSYEFDEYSGSNAFAIIKIQIPKTFKTCTQRVFVEVTDTLGTTATTDDITERSFFIIEAIRPGII